MHVSGVFRALKIGRKKAKQKGSVRLVSSEVGTVRDWVLLGLLLTNLHELKSGWQAGACVDRGW